MNTPKKQLRMKYEEMMEWGYPPPPSPFSPGTSKEVRVLGPWVPPQGSARAARSSPRFNKSVLDFGVPTLWS